MLNVEDIADGIEEEERVEDIADGSEEEGVMDTAWLELGGAGGGLTMEGSQMKLEDRSDITFMSAGQGRELY